MENLLINRVLIELTDASLPLYLTCEKASGFTEKQIATVRKAASTDPIQQTILELVKQNPNSESLFFGFRPLPNSQNCEISLKENRYFIKPFLDHCLYDHFVERGFAVCKSFFDDLDVWERQNESNVPDSHKYLVFNIKIVFWQGECYLQIGLGRETHVYSRSVNQLPDDSKVRKILHNQQVYRYRKDRRIKGDEYYPVLNRDLMNQLNISGHSGERIGPHADYRLYFESISRFYKDHILGAQIDDHFKILSSGFAEVHENNKFRVNYNRNLMVFKNNNTDVNVFNGLKRYGPFKEPTDISSVKFIFIYYQKDRNLANSFYRYLKSGYRNFPGLYQFVGIQLILDVDTRTTIAKRRGIAQIVMTEGS